jgi:hypothetical protein
MKRYTRLCRWLARLFALLAGFGAAGSLLLSGLVTLRRGGIDALGLMLLAAALLFAGSAALFAWLGRRSAAGKNGETPPGRE